MHIWIFDDQVLTTYLGWKTAAGAAPSQVTVAVPQQKLIEELDFIHKDLGVSQGDLVCLSCSIFFGSLINGRLNMKYWLYRRTTIA